jgi:hypothetical protein
MARYFWIGAFKPAAVAAVSSDALLSFGGIRVQGEPEPTNPQKYGVPPYPVSDFYFELPDPENMHVFLSFPAPSDEVDRKTWVTALLEALGNQKPESSIVFVVE